MKLLAAIALSAFLLGTQNLHAQGSSGMKHHAVGPFDVKTSPAELPSALETSVGRMTIDKQFHGTLEGTSKGEMMYIGAGDPKGGASAYVALERVTGTLDGRKGSFVLLHKATMNAGVPAMEITVMPGSGTDALAGLTGAMQIIIADKKHSYDFAYELP